ncbi:MAG: D-alanyl-D-alanine carboxypeptidase/D-alanyl-D-alanine-endopeptidase [Actinobacteria bacterium]|nr:D-alanyl-D-alanine carboxypeptidase/D-alanyl-D-alanine-endopeptidase [Actinomycetota bacterium]
MTRHRFTRRGVALTLSLACALAALASVTVAVRVGAATERLAVPEARMVTPLVSLRRVPQLVGDDVATARLQQSLQATMARTDACLAVDGPTGRIVSINADTPLAPASTMKLLTAVAALAVFGPDYRFRTTVVATAPPRGGVVDRLWLVGSGDPVLATPARRAALAADSTTRGDVTTPFEALADAIVAAGVRSVPDGIAGDDHLFDTSRQLSVWPARFVADNEIGPLGALTVDAGFVPPAGTRAADPALNAAAQLETLLGAREVEVGPAGHATAPKGTTVIASVSSPPLHDIIGSMLSSSDNLSAELLARLLGTTVASPGTTQAGVQVVVDQLHRLGVETASLHVLDGSGLSPDDRVPCNVLLQVFELGDRERFRAVADGLPIAGLRGTLADRFVGTPLAGHLRAKTGSLDGVTALVGMLDLHVPLRFAYVGNGSFAENAGVTMRENIATVLATYPDTTSASAVVPPPAPPVRAPS